MSSADDSDYSFEGSDSADENFFQAPKVKSARTPPAKKRAVAKPATQPALSFGLVNDAGAGHQVAGNGVATRQDLPVKTAIGAKKKTVEEIYKQKTQLEHILLRPDTYIGSVEATQAQMWVMDDGKMEFRNVTFVPGLYKIFDEILVNAADNKVRDPSMDTIKVWINKSENSICIQNNGKGVPVSVHTEAGGVYVPELIFGHLLTSSNYDDDDKKIVGGRNGYGAKLCNIFSKEFTVETSDCESGHKYQQVFSDNMSKTGKPKLTKAAKQDFTKITFKPDLAKFGMTELDDDIVALLARRVYDIAGVVANVKVFLNDERIKIKNFKEYVALYLDSVKHESKPALIYEKPDPRWEVCFALGDSGQFQQVSFVNSICTSKGGTHVNMIADQIAKKTNEIIKRKNKGEGLKLPQIKSRMWVFINAQIENPSFDSQTKENLTLKANKFGSTSHLSEEFLKKVYRSGFIESIMQFTLMKQATQLKQKDGAKRTRLSGIAKLDDANNAGTRQGKNCTLILTEGDSAKALAISGLSVVGRDNFGVFPLRGKLLNVREATHKQIIENAEINHIKQILGLKSEKEYTSTDSLRYGHVMIMADQDHDGSHIKGLIINLFDRFWPSLLANRGFLLQFITPIVRVTKGTREMDFYNIPEYESWKEAHNDGKGWTIKYYKGLGTSTAADAKKYFSRMNDHLKPFARSQEQDREHIELAFSKKKADDRKEWLANLADGTYIDHTMREIPIHEFVNKELILFSMADNVRSIPSAVDGFKPGQRKILFSCFKRNLTKAELKVAQLAGYVSEHSAYHHGEASLQSTIINLAQNYVGSNNLNLLEPRGQFGTRLQGGKDHAHARYIFTKLPPITRMVYNIADDRLLNYLNEENMSIEPEWYIPIIPMVLVNGAEGIGTGWSTSVLNYNPRDVVNNIQRRLNGEEFQVMHPWYRGFNGTIERDGERYKVSGVVNEIDDTTIEITELPLGVWTQSYKEFLEGLLTGTDKVAPSIKDYKEYHTDVAVHFVVELSSDQMAKAKEDGLHKKFKITTLKSVSNMVLFNAQGRLKKYESVYEILLEFYDLRLDYYQKRKDWLVAKLRRELSKYENQVRFILQVISGELVVQNRKCDDVIHQLRANNYDAITKAQEAESPEDPAVADTKNESDTQHGFDYLLSMPILNLTMEKVQKLKADRDTKKAELEELLATASSDLWRRDLDAFIAEWDRFEAVVEDTSKNTTTKSRKPLSTKKPKLSIPDEGQTIFGKPAIRETQRRITDILPDKGNGTLGTPAVPETPRKTADSTPDKAKLMLGTPAIRDTPGRTTDFTPDQGKVMLGTPAIRETPRRTTDSTPDTGKHMLETPAIRETPRRTPGSTPHKGKHMLGTPAMRDTPGRTTDFTADQGKHTLGTPAVRETQRRITDLFSGVRAVSVKRELETSTGETPPASPVKRMKFETP
ncbi:DNA topoisomerase 2 [Geranomyces variabilis]|nr:DNA topoisomerase 2 [Geranomyces variabilis]